MILDVVIIIIAVIIVICGIVGRFSRQVIALIEIGLLICAVLLAGVLGRAMFFNDTGVSGLGQTMSGWFNGVSANIPGADVKFTNSEELTKALTEAGIPESFVGQITSEFGKIGKIGIETQFETLSELVSGVLGLLVLECIIFIVLVIIILIGSVFVRRKLNQKEILNPTFRRYDRIIGGLTAALTAYILVSVLLATLSKFGGEIVLEFIAKSSLGKWLYNNNFIGKIFFREIPPLPEVVELISKIHIF